MAACGRRLGCAPVLGTRSAALRVLQRPRRRAPRAPPAPPRAALYELPSGAADALRVAAAVGVALGLGLSALPILTGEAKERNRAWWERGRGDEGEEGAGGEGADSAAAVRWGVMGALSLLPLLHPLAWVFAALDDDESPALYAAFAAVYSLPYVASGLEVDGFAVAALLAGAAHVQLERVARTEPVEVELPDVVRAAARAAAAALGAARRAGAAAGGEAAARAARAGAARRRRPDRRELEERSREARAQLEEFDERRRARLREEEDEGADWSGRGGGGGGGGGRPPPPPPPPR